MASCRTHGGDVGDEVITTYGTGKTRVEGELSIWEAATDVDLTEGGNDTIQVLEVYKEGAAGGLWDDYDELDGATTDATHFRLIRPASGEGHSGIPVDDGSMAGFRTTTFRFYVLRVAEDNSKIQDIVGSNNNESADVQYVFTLIGNNSALIGCIVFDSANAGASVTRGVRTNPASGENNFVINCLVHNTDDSGYYFHAGAVDGNTYCYNSIAQGCGDYGFRGGNGAHTIKNCLSDSNTDTEYNGTFIATTCGSSDVSSPTVALRNQTYSYEAGVNNFHLASGSDGVDDGTDLSGDGSFPFDDDINDGVMGAGKAGETRSGTWDIGFDEYVSAVVEVPGIDVVSVTDIADVIITRLRTLGITDVDSVTAIATAAITRLRTLGVIGVDSATAIATSVITRLRTLAVIGVDSATVIDTVRINTGIISLVVADVISATAIGASALLAMNVQRSPGLLVKVW